MFRYPALGNRSPLLMLAMAGAVECIKLALAHGAGVNLYDDKGYTALAVACSPNGPCSCHNSDVVEVLLEAKSRVNLRTGDGLTPLSLAAQSNDVDSVRLLLAAGGSVSTRCLLGFSPVVWGLVGSGGSLTECISMLLSAAAAVTSAAATALRNAHAVAQSGGGAGGAGGTGGTGGTGGEEADNTREISVDASTLANARLTFDLSQDIKCFCFSQLLRTLQGEHVKLGGPAALTAERALATRTAVVEKLMELLQVPVEGAGSGGSVTRTLAAVESSANILERIQSSVEAAIPAIMAKRWLVRVTDADTGASASTAATAAGGVSPMSRALALAAPQERCWLQILMTAAYGPRPPGSPPFLIKAPFSTAVSALKGSSSTTSVVSEISSTESGGAVALPSPDASIHTKTEDDSGDEGFLVVSLFLEYSLFLRDAVVFVYSAATPTVEACAVIAGYGPLAVVTTQAASATSPADGPVDRHIRGELFWGKELERAGASVHMVSIGEDSSSTVGTGHTPVLIVPDLLASIDTQQQHVVVSQLVALLMAVPPADFVVVVGECGLIELVAQTIDSSGSADEDNDESVPALSSAAVPRRSIATNGDIDTYPVAHGTPFSIEFGATYEPVQATLSSYFEPRRRVMLPNWLWERNEAVVWCRK